MDHYALLLLVTLFPLVCSRWTGEYDHFTFAQSWPPGVCADAPREHHTCHVDKQVTTWTIHGLWPTQGSEIGPHDCNSSMKFDFSKIASLQKDLLTFWPNLYNDTELESFWSHEWTKHGTCAQDLPETTGELNYFSKGLEMNQKYDMLKMLSDGGVTPSPTAQYSYKQFMAAVKQSTGFDPNIECSYIKLDNGTDFHLVSEIEICLSKTDFTPVACPGSENSSKGGNQSGSYKTIKSQSNCPQHYNFNYPPIQYVLNRKTGMFELPDDLIGR
ncbi:ribonuclease Oy-like [Dreissena polymorpha]|uniref:ribonuclease Oy-like n=1 Tax=Dreissena polymorpha TaxID=45954 RepID=UPI0022645892|nr:ribonuclease Oy-like [Dreissena polymorpha]XP_052284300.1 ribonuclease Oy-like [Dreissena polymorpha]XP_052284301.1 ribonuclease Oy-like [Dreissena polymorpha]XP_052284302.1 ribonuclease Oy-like [Dreissena polymorpha]